MATNQESTFGRAARAAFRSFVLLVTLTLESPALRRRVREARALLGAAAAVYLRSRPAPSFLARALAERRAAEARLAQLARASGSPPSGQVPAVLATIWRHPLLVFRRRRITARLRAADMELGGWAVSLTGTRGYLSAAQRAVAVAEAELREADARRAAARQGLRTYLAELLALTLAVPRRLTGSVSTRWSRLRDAAAARRADRAARAARAASAATEARPAGSPRPAPATRPSAPAPGAPAGGPPPVPPPARAVPPPLPPLAGRVAGPASPPAAGGPAPPRKAPAAAPPAGSEWSPPGPAGGRVQGPPAPAAPVRPAPTVPSSGNGREPAPVRPAAAVQARERHVRRNARRARREATRAARREAIESKQATRAAAAVVTSLAEPPDEHREGVMRFLRPIAVALVLTALLGGGVALPAGMLLAGRVTAAEAGLPDLGALDKLRRPERTEVFDRYGNRIAVLRDEQDRIVLKLEEIPKLMQDAVISVEDERFYEHKGVDERGIVRAALANLVKGRTAQGGSTITQQLIRNSYPDLKDISLVRKIKEAALAAQLETRTTKHQILEDYLNLVYFGSGYYGVEAASQGYFGKSVKKLMLHEAALLAGIIRSPEGVNPRSTNRTVRERCRQLRNAVIDLMVAQGKVDPQVAARAKAAPVRVKPPRPTAGKYPFFIDYIKQHLLGDPPSDRLSRAKSDRTGDRRLGGSYEERKRALFEGGLKIYTTLDPMMQESAEAAVKNRLPADGRADAGLVSIDPRTGAIRAMVGGRNYRTAKYNYAWQARRSPGSSFKTFVLATALSEGISPDSLWESSGIPMGTDICGITDWAPQNYEGSGSGPISLREATARSVNGVYARVMGKVCPEKVAAMAARLGVTIRRADRHAPAIALGGTSVRVIDMASAYSTLASGGIYHRPTAVTKVIRRSTGQLVWEEASKGVRRIPEALAYETTQVLKGVIQAGTAARNGQLGRPAAGKTGTSQNYANAWFVGYTPQLSTAVWIGNPKGEFRFTINQLDHVTGGSFPTMIWHDYMAAALQGAPPEDFPPPADHLTYTFLPPPSTTPGSTIPGQPPGPPGQPPGQLPGPGGPNPGPPGQTIEPPGNQGRG
ncbi:MAG TPA: transglycosylase domain-containing protein [Actinomycetes bacterium]|nr:transglycosylase domain-containing protein [Actinomycetes bacterium]